MGITRTAEEALAERSEKMGDPLGPVYHHLWQEMAWLYAKWNEYLTLYGTNASRVELLNEAAPYFFRVMQDALWEDTVLHIARLTDPATTGRKRNLSVQQLPALVNDAELSEKLGTQVGLVLAASEFCRDWRNRRIAHSDLDLAVGSAATELSPGSRRKVKDVLSLLTDVLDSVSTHYLGSSTMFDMGANNGGGEILLRVLHDGVSAGKERRERVCSGRATPTDFQRPEF